MLTDIYKNAAAFLQQGVAPPNTPPEQVESLSNTNHLSSKKFFLAISGFVILGIFYFLSVGILFLIMKNPTAVTTYSVMFTKTMEVFATIMAVYLGGQALVDLKYNSSSGATSQATTNETVNTTNYNAKIEEITVIHTNSKDDDYELE
jgi:hypothetical protein